MRILGIDPGIEKTGFAVLENENGKIVLCDCGYINTSRRDPFSVRLNTLAGDLKNIIKKWKPTVAGLEKIFFAKNVKTAINVSHARGVILELLEEQAITVFEFNPGQIKSAVTGDGRADKSQIKKMVQCLLGVSLKNDDTADAIACGICLLNSYPILRSQLIAQ